MLFSGMVRHFGCSSCKREFADIHFSSLIPTLGTLAMAGMAWMEISHRWTNIGWLAAILGFCAALLSFVLIYGAVDFLSKWKARKGVCPACGGKLENQGSGFYDSLKPHPMELLIYGLAVALPFAIRIFA